MCIKPEVDPHNKIMGSLQCKTCSLRLLLMAIWGLSLLLNVLQAVPVSRTGDLADQKNYKVVGDTEDQMIEEDMWEQGTDEQFIHGRMDFQSTDYPWGDAHNNRRGTGGGYREPGPNNRHVPGGDYEDPGANNIHVPGGGGSRTGKNAPP